MSFWKIDDSLYEQLMKVEERVLEAARSKQPALNQMTTELAAAPGKRIRPALVLMASSYGPKPKESIVDVAAAMEILHIASLIHDDIIDETKLRKGIETTQSKYGKDMAVYAGDYLFTRCFQLLAGAGSGDHLEKVARATMVICEGEVNQYSDRYNPTPSVLGYLRKIHGKTATLFALCTAVGAHHSECTQPVTRTLAHFGLWFGMAFQIYDDLLDFTSDTTAVGKPVHHDLMEGVYTLPIIYALQGRKGKQLKDLLNIGTKDAINVALDLVRQSEGLPRTELLLSKYVEKAKKCIRQLPPNPCNEILTELLVSAFPKNGAPLASFRIA